MTQYQINTSQFQTIVFHQHAFIQANNFYDLTLKSISIDRAMPNLTLINQLDQIWQMIISKFTSKIKGYSPEMADPGYSNCFASFTDLQMWQSDNILPIYQVFIFPYQQNTASVSFHG